MKKFVKRVPMLTLLLLVCFSASVFADGNLTFGGGTMDADFANALNAGFAVIKKIIVPIAAVGLTLCGFQFLTASEKGIEQAKTNCLRICTAVMAFLLIPAVISFGVNICSGNGWNPDGNNDVGVNVIGDAPDLSQWTPENNSEPDAPSEPE